MSFCFIAMEVFFLLVSWIKEEQTFVIPILVGSRYVFRNFGRNFNSATQVDKGSSYRCCILYEISSFGADDCSNFRISTLQVAVIMSLIYILCFKYHEVTIRAIFEDWIRLKGTIGHGSLGYASRRNGEFCFDGLGCFRSNYIHDLACLFHCIDFWKRGIGLAPLWVLESLSRRLFRTLPVGNFDELRSNLFSIAFMLLFPNLLLREVWVIWL